MACARWGASDLLRSNHIGASTTLSSSALPSFRCFQVLSGALRSVGGIRPPQIQPHRSLHHSFIKCFAFFQVLSGAFRCFALGGGHQTSSDPTTSEPPPLFHQVHSALPSLFGGLEVGSSFANNMIIFGTEKESFIQKTVRLYWLWCLWPSEKQ